MSKENKNENLKKEKHDQKKLVHECNELKECLKLKDEQLTKFQERIEQLEKERKQIDEFYKIEVIQKAKLAQEEVHRKVEEITHKLKKELEHAKKYAIEDDAIELINIISQFENAINFKTDNSAITNYLNGFRMFSSMFQNLLSNMNIHEISIKVGDSFNETTMEAIITSKNLSLAKNSVVKIIKKGYQLYDKVIQFAQVEVNE